MTDHIEIGYILKTHGYKGSVKVRVDPHYIDGLADLQAVFLQLDAELIPYFPDSVDPISDNEAIFHFEEVKSKEDAQKLKGRKLFARKDEVAAKTMEEAGPAELIGYVVEDAELGVIGPVEEVYSLPQQELLGVQYKGKEVLIPLREELIIEFQADKRTIVFDLPEGILEL